MQRKAIIIRKSSDGKRCVCVDVENAETILAYAKLHQKKFNHIVGIILNQLRVPDLYDKENINKQVKSVTAMKFFKGGSNDRIYCKEFTQNDKTFTVVAVELFEKKKTQKNSPKITHLINKISNYEYQIIERHSK
ncbi:MAG: hypothetical protein R3342_04930 [Lutibacter sp.]|uniref:hypothetical protein n=1 Tax=Lutibacter sp. TaxID=1925666 RepID=UPI00299F3822|nr:hypothetical protein [Lutibacter sp.]MDX1828874.1 hypothetical protein [Lutibacter sp.]